MSGRDLRYAPIARGVMYGVMDLCLRILMGFRVSCIYGGGDARHAGV